jgi:hypothetical protein
VIGSFCLIAGWSWSRLVASLSPDERGRAGTAFAAVAVLCILVALPLHAWQVHRFVAPYARASAQIAAADADVVIVDEAGIWYGMDLVRNDPFLENRPLVLRLKDLDQVQVKAIEADWKVVNFGRAQAERAGILVISAP